MTFPASADSLPTVDAVIVINAKAGTAHGINDAQALTEKFRDAGLNAEIFILDTGEKLVQKVRAAVEANVPIIVAGGGDGTLNTAASFIVGSNSKFGILPLGTLNHFAKDIHVPFVLDDAIAVIAGGYSELFDTGEVNGHLFLNNSGLGLYPDIVRNRQRQQVQHGRRKWLAFLFASWSALRRYPVMTIQLTADGKSTSRKTPFIFIGNNIYETAGLEAGTRSTLQDGVLSVGVAHKTSRMGLLRLAFHALRGKLAQTNDFDALTVHELVIQSKVKRLPVATDGEVQWMATPLRYQIHPRSLRVLVPPPQNKRTD